MTGWLEQCKAEHHWPNSSQKFATVLGHGQYSAFPEVISLLETGIFSLSARITPFGQLQRMVAFSYEKLRG
jgi:hypothetical protein